MIYLNSTALNISAFPNNETLLDTNQIRKNLKAVNEIVLKYKSDLDLLHLMFVKQYIDSCNPGNITVLRIAYMPYSRMDRSENNSVFTLKYVANFINSLNFESIVIIEPHSDVTMALIDRAQAVYPTFKLLDNVKCYTSFDEDTDILFYPDAGAQKRYNKIFQDRALVGFKDRDFATGQIKSLDLVGNIPKRGFKAIIVDDLCSKGGTFIGAADKLKAVGASYVYLLVTHCEENIYNGDIFKTDLIDGVFTTNSIIDESKDSKMIIIQDVVTGVI